MLFTLANEKIEKVVINDINEDLINVYISIEKDVEMLIEELNNYKFKNNNENYYDIRNKYNNSEINKQNLYDITRAAMFIYLNRTGYGGLYRVNKKGKYNVPYWQKPEKKTFLPEYDNLKLISDYLNNYAEISCGDFSKVLLNCDKDDFIYLDPPYHDNKFQYNMIKFDWNDQLRIKEIVEILNFNGCKWMITNRDNDKIRELFKEYNIIDLKSELKIDSKQKMKEKNKDIYKEIAIINYCN